VLRGGCAAYPHVSRWGFYLWLPCSDIARRQVMDSWMTTRYTGQLWIPYKQFQIVLGSRSGGPLAGTSDLIKYHTVRNPMWHGEAIPPINKPNCRQSFGTHRRPPAQEIFAMNTAWHAVREKHQHSVVKWLHSNKFSDLNSGVKAEYCYTLTLSRDFLNCWALCPYIDVRVNI